MKYKVLTLLIFIWTIGVGQISNSEIICDIEEDRSLVIENKSPTHGKYNQLEHGYIINYVEINDDHFCKLKSFSDKRDSINFVKDLFKKYSKNLHFVPDYFIGSKKFYNPNCLFSIFVGQKEFFFSHITQEFPVNKDRLYQLIVKDLVPNAYRHYRGAKLELQYVYSNNVSRKITYEDNIVTFKELSEKASENLLSIKILSLIHI